MVTVDDVFEGLKKNNRIPFHAWGGVNECSENGGTLLTWAIRSEEDLDIINFLIKQGADVNMKEKKGLTPLLIAIYLNRLDVVKCLVANGADVRIKDPYDSSPLVVAIQENSIDIVKFLLCDFNTNVRRWDMKGTPPLIKAINENRLEIVQTFVRSNVGVDVADQNKNTPLIAAIRNDSTLDIIECLLKYGVDIDETKNHKTPVEWAAEKENIGVLNLFLKYKADIHLLNTNKNNLLSYAILNRKLKVVTFLVENGANVCKIDSIGKTPLEYAIDCENLIMVKLFLDHGAEFIVDKVFLHAIEQKNLSIVKLLKERGATVKNEHGSWYTPLRAALRVESVEIAKYLIDNGANVVEDLGKDEISQIIYFLEKKNVAMIKLLTENGARLNECSKCGETLLTKAILLENFEMVKYFLSQGADVYKTNKSGLKPLVIAESVAHFPIFQYLVNFGVQINEGDETKFPDLAKHFQKAYKVKPFIESGSNQEESKESAEDGNK